jgi:hypothetical protein
MVVSNSDRLASDSDSGTSANYYLLVLLNFNQLLMLARYQWSLRAPFYIRLYATRAYRYKPMGKNKKQSIPDEAHLLLPAYAINTGIVDTHTHLVSTFAQYQSKYKGGKYETIYDFVRGLYQGRKVESIVDVWCEAPVQTIWRELADSALKKDERWSGIEYWFIMGQCFSYFISTY